MSEDPLNPLYLKGFNDGTRNGKKEASLKFTEYLIERVNTLKDIKGIGDQKAMLIQNHLLEGVNDNEEGQK